VLGRVAAVSCFVLRVTLVKMCDGVYGCGRAISSSRCQANRPAAVSSWWDQRSSSAAETARLKRRLEALGHNVILEPDA
jgi:hypothetical protein